MTPYEGPVPDAGDMFAPARIAGLVEDAGVHKANLPFLQTFVLAVLAGAFIAFGAMLFTTTVTGSELGLGPTRLLGGAAFSLGLILVVVAGSELFTGNNLIVMACVDGKITTARVLRNWAVVYAGNFVGAVATALMVAVSGVLAIGSDGETVAMTAASIAKAKVALDPAEAFMRGVLCNTLVCLAVWLSMAARRVSGKILAILFPITAFVALGFEHSIANLYFIPLGIFIGAEGVTLAGLASNLIPVTLGNIVGGSVLVALVYWLCYVRLAKAE